MTAKPRVIKADQLAPLKPAPFNTVDTLQATQERIDQAKAEIERLQRGAQTDAAKLKETSQKDGYKKGYDDGLAQGKADAKIAHQTELAKAVQEKTAELQKAVKDSVSQLLSHRDHWLATWENQAVEVICAIAERVIRRAIQPPDDAVRRIVSETLALVGRCPNVKLTLHPEDAKTLDLVGDQWRSATAGIGAIDVVHDDKLPRGGCRVETQFGSIDATIATQLQRIENELLGKSV